MNAIVMRDSLRNEVAKQRQLEEELKEKKDQQRTDMAKLNLMINQGEEQMIKLRKRYERNVQHRNDRLDNSAFDMMLNIHAREINQLNRLYFFLNLFF